MKSISVLDIWKLNLTTSTPSDLICLINCLLYNEPNIDTWNINANINVFKNEKVVIDYNQDDLTNNVC